MICTTIEYNRSERQDTNDTVDTATASMDTRSLANSNDLFRKYDGLHDILADNDNLRLKVRQDISANVILYR